MEQLMARTPEGVLIALLVAMLATVAALTVQIVRGKAALKTKFFDISPVVQNGDERINLQNRLNAMHKAMWRMYGAVRSEHPSYRELSLMEFVLDCERYFTARILLNHITTDDAYVNAVADDIKAIYIRAFHDEGMEKIDGEEMRAIVRHTLERIKGGKGDKR